MLPLSRLLDWGGMVYDVLVFVWWQFYGGGKKELPANL